MAFETIKINGVSFPRPPEFSPQKEDVISAQITTMSGKVLADRIGWKYSDMTLEWEYLAESLLKQLFNLSGDFTIQFDVPGTDSADQSTFVSENAYRTSIVSMRNKQTLNGYSLWTDVKMSITFTETHS